MALEIVPATQADLHQIAQLPGAIRAGSTANVDQRAEAYGREGYSGTMFVAPTKNMQQAEDALLQSHNFRHNVQSASNAQQAAGHVYVIKGRRSGG